MVNLILTFSINNVFDKQGQQMVQIIQLDTDLV